MFGPNGNIYYVSSDDGFITIKTLMIQLTNEFMFFYLKMIFLGNNMIYLGYFFFYWRRCILFDCYFYNFNKNG